MTARGHDRTVAKRCRGDAGEVTSTVFVMPIVLFMIMVVVQMALTWHAKTVVDAAASDGLASAQVENGTDQAGIDAANNLLAGSSEQLLTDIDITVDRQAETTSVRIQARVTNVVPFAPIYVDATASGPTEHFRPGTGS